MFSNALNQQKYLFDDALGLSSHNSIITDRQYVIIHIYNFYT